MASNTFRCHIQKYDAMCFLIPVLLLPLAQFVQLMFMPSLWVSPFWIAAFIYPGFLLIRNFLARKKVNRAGKILKKYGVEKPEAVLFRSTSKELAEIGSLDSAEQLAEYISAKADSELRWQVISKRFFKFESGENNG